MTIECYKADCPYHTCHTDPEDGPFCYEDHCRFVSGASVIAMIDTAAVRGHLCGSQGSDGRWLVSVEGDGGWRVHESNIELIKE